MNRELIDSLHEKDFRRSLELVEAGADPNTTELTLSAPTLSEIVGRLFHRSPPHHNGTTAFMIVCCSNLLISEGIFFQNPPLEHLAEVMLAHGANVNARDNELGDTALMLASRNDTDSMSFLLKHGDLINIQDSNGDTALLLSVEYYNTEGVELLLKYHANTNLKNRFGHTALWYMLHVAPHYKLPPHESLLRKNISHLLKAAGATE